MLASVNDLNKYLRSTYKNDVQVDKYRVQRINGEIQYMVFTTIGSLEIITEKRLREVLDK